ncbi:uncharacterized protein LOC135373093 [Ornithodoros turicata]|uniref:uncharacterized protein LOC135373093 n=1 Tax=Ornithodoros turicata TaxID=34597 RepID=UPI003138D6BB
MKDRTLLLRDFFVPSLDESRYGQQLRWVDRASGIFCIQWEHQGKKAWKEENGSVFKDWSLRKKRWDCKDPERMSKAKQRIRSALGKQINLRKVDGYDVGECRLYQILDMKEIDRELELSSPKRRPTSVKKRPLAPKQECKSRKRSHLPKQTTVSTARVSDEEIEEFWCDTPIYGTPCSSAVSSTNLRIDQVYSCAASSAPEETVRSTTADGCSVDGHLNSLNELPSSARERHKKARSKCSRKAQLKSRRHNGEPPSQKNVHGQLGSQDTAIQKMFQVVKGVADTCEDANKGCQCTSDDVQRLTRQMKKLVKELMCVEAAFSDFRKQYEQARDTISTMKGPDLLPRSHLNGDHDMLVDGNQIRRILESKVYQNIECRKDSVQGEEEGATI